MSAIDGSNLAETTEPYESLQEQQVLNDAQENNRENQDLVEPSLVDIVLKVCFILLSIPWIISVIFFSIFDTKCVIFEQASVINCSQDFFISNPRHWISTWLFMSIISSFLVIFIIYINHKNLNYQSRSAKTSTKKDHFTR